MNFDDDPCAEISGFWGWMAAAIVIGAVAAALFPLPWFGG
jgi:hypothetical protein